jgi:choline dehydrogenase-like flavoprotein
MEKTYDIVVIGGGVAGALVAWKVSELMPGLKIAILEAGTDRSAERTDMSLAFAASLIKSPISAYDKNPAIALKSPADLHDYYSKDSDTFKSTYLRTGGGTTWHWLGNTPRHLPNDFRLQSKYGRGVDWPICYGDLEKYYCDAEAAMGVSGNHEEWNNFIEGATRTRDFPMPMIWPSYLEKTLKPVLDGKSVEGQTIRVRSTPQARNSQAYEDRPACAGNSSCVPICPIGAKYDATVHLRKAAANGVTIIYQAGVNTMETDQGGNITHIKFFNWAGEEDSVQGKMVVLAAHAIESSILLLFNKLAGGSGLVGKNLMDHPQGYGVGVYSDPLFTFRGPPTTSGIDAYRDGDFRKDSAAFRISIGNDGWSRFVRKNNPQKIDNLEFLVNEKFGSDKIVIGKAFREAIAQKVTRMFRFSYSTEMLPDENNKVELSTNTEPDNITRLPRPKISFVIDRQGDYNNKAFLMAGRVLTGLFTALKVAPADFEVQNSQSDFSGAGHIMGTLRMGNDAASSVVDKNLRVHDHSNLFIIGSGVFPTACTANPTLTIAALSLRLADHLTSQIQSKTR